MIRPALRRPVEVKASSYPDDVGLNLFNVDGRPPVFRLSLELVAKAFSHEVNQLAGRLPFALSKKLLGLVKFDERPRIQCLINLLGHLLTPLRWEVRLSDQVPGAPKLVLANCITKPTENVLAFQFTTRVSLEPTFGFRYCHRSSSPVVGYVAPLPMESFNLHLKVGNRIFVTFLFLYLQFRPQRIDFHIELIGREISAH